MTMNGSSIDRDDHSSDDHSPDNLHQMALALDIAWEQLPAEADRSDEARRTLATIIIEHFEGGEHDPARLGDLAAAELVSRPDQQSVLASD